MNEKTNPDPRYWHKPVRESWYPKDLQSPDAPSRAGDKLAKVKRADPPGNKPAQATEPPQLWLNFLLFQIVYALSLLGVIQGIAWLGAIALVTFAFWHVRRTRTAKSDLLVVIVAMAVGFALDTLYLRSGLIRYNGELLWTGAAPLWIVVLWANFALTLGSSLRWLRGRLWLAAAFSAAFAPLSYYAGIRMGTASIAGSPLQMYALISVTWLCAVPLLLWLSAQLEKILHPHHSADEFAALGVKRLTNPVRLH